MINKRSLWFLTLFSLILVLSIYYVTMPSELLMTTKNTEETKEVSKTEDTKTSEESAELVSLKVEAEEKMLDEITELKKVLTNSKSTTEEKNNAFEKMQELNKNRSNETSLEKKIEEEFKLKSFVSIEDTKITITLDTKELDKKTANQIMRKVQENFDKAMSITVKYQK